MREFYLNIKKSNKLLFSLIVILYCIGLLMIQSASAFESYSGGGNSPYYYFFKQLGIVCLAFIGYFTIINIPFKFYERTAIFFMWLGVGAVLGVTLIGTVANSAQSWYGFGIFGIQPSEFAKPIIVLYLAYMYSQKRNQLDDKAVLIFPLILPLVVLILVFIQPDLGTSIIIAGIMFSMLIFAPITSKYRVAIIGWALATLAVVLCGVFMGVVPFLKPYQLDRFNFFSPCSRYQEDSGYQVCNGFIAINNGGLLGRGIGNSIQKYLYLPYGYTDFIFPIVVEELGLIVAMFIILMMFALVYLIYMIGDASTNYMGKLLCNGICVYILLHMIVNLGGVTGMLPLTGVPLPFLTYGGSFAISLMGGLALVQRVHIENMNAKKLKKKIQ